MVAILDPPSVFFYESGRAVFRRGWEADFNRRGGENFEIGPNRIHRNASAGKSGFSGIGSGNFEFRDDFQAMLRSRIGSGGNIRGGRGGFRMAVSGAGRNRFIGMAGVSVLDFGIGRIRQTMVGKDGLEDSRVHDRHLRKQPDRKREDRRGGFTQCGTFFHNGILRIFFVSSHRISNNRKFDNGPCYRGIFFTMYPYSPSSKPRFR